MDSPEAVDVSKENIQPLRQGRIVSQLGAALQSQTDASVLHNLIKKRQEYELLLRTYDGNDPLSIWFEYIEWVEQSFPKDGKEGNLMTLLQNCLTRFKDSVEYFQDIRLVKLWIKYLEKLENPLELYSQLHCHGIGSQCALFYKCWAYEFYENGDFKRANKVLLSGIRRHAQPLDELQRAHINFTFAVARRVLDESLPVSEENTVEEERKFGNVLTTFGKKHKVPSVRIGERVKSNFPGTLDSKKNLMPQRNVDHVNIYEAENDPELARSVNKMQTIPHFEILKKENTKKPIPWSGVKQKTAHQFHPPKPSFQVLTDENSQPEHLNTVMVLNALKPRKEGDGFNCPIAIFEVPNPNQQSMYPKEQVYAGGTEYSLEELKAVKYVKPKEKRNKALLGPDSQDATQKETLCTTSDSTEAEKLNPLTACVSGIGVHPSKKESNFCNYTENNMFPHKEHLSVSRNIYEKCNQADTSSRTGSDCVLRDNELSEEPTVPNSQYQHCVEGPKYTDSASNHLAEMENLHSSVSCRILTPITQSIVNGSSVPNNVHHSEMQCSENTDITSSSSSTKKNYCTQDLLLATNDQQKVKESGCTLFATGDGTDLPDSVKADVSSLNKNHLLCSENADTMSSRKQRSYTSALLAENEQQKLHNQGVFILKESNLSVLTVEGRTCSPETVKVGDVFTSLNEKEIRHSKTSNIMVSNKQSSCTPSSLGDEIDQQKQMNHGKSMLKARGFSVFTTENVIGTTETLKVGDFFNSLNKDISFSENAGIMLLTKPSSCNSSALVSDNKQQKLHNQDTFSVKGSDFSVITTVGGTDAPQTVKTGDNFSSVLEKVKISHSDHTNDLLLSNKIEGLRSPILMQGNENKQYGEIHEENISVNKNCFAEFPIFSDEENCYAKGQGGLVKGGQENGFSGFPSRTKNIFSHSVLCEPNNPLHDDVRFTSSTTKKNKVAPFPLFIEDGEVPVDHELCATKRELFKEATCEPSDKLCFVDSKENLVLPYMYTPVSRPITEKREMKVCDNIVTASMIKLRQKRASEQIKGPAAEEFEQVTPATTVPKKSGGCVPSSISATSEEVLKVINECWASPPKSKGDAGNLCPEPQKEPEERDFQHCLPLKMSALFPENKENALPQSTKQNVLEPSNTSVNDDWFMGQLGEPRPLDDTCCTLMFSKTLISSTPNRKSRGPLSDDSSNNRFVRHLDQVMSPIAMMQLGLGVFNGCMLIFPAAYSAESDALVKCLAAVPTISTQLLLYCLGAHSVREQGESVSAAAYSCGWPESSRRCRLALLLVMRRAQRPLALSAGGIYPIQRATFLSLLNAGYSYYAVLQNFNSH